MKKRGFGKGLWNGVGGKIEPGETMEQALVRESQEEVGLTPTSWTKVAMHDFYMHEGVPSAWHMQGHVYFCREWEGEATETEEMAPKWTKIKDMPYDNMWSDDIVWLPQSLMGKLLKGTFRFDGDAEMTEAHLEIVQSLE
jgi:mutator protein MutT